VYTDEPVTFVLDGHLIDASTRADVTEQRLEALAKINFDDLPLALAFTQVRGDGSRRIAIFEDPNCGYCKQLRRNMEGIDNLTVHTFLLPILSADSTEKVKNVWCAENKGEVWDEWMLLGVEPPVANCDAPIDDFLSLARSLGIEGTPAMFFADGSRVPGAISQEALIKRLQ
jgi:thiol:disulfide interchange protein DsbC